MNSYGKIKIVHNIPDAEVINVYLGNDKILSNVTYKSSSSYLSAISGAYQLTIEDHKSGSIIISKHILIEPREEYTAIIVGSMINPSAISIILLNDDNRCSANEDEAHIRFVHAAYGVQPVDFYINGTPYFNNVRYGSLGYPTYMVSDSKQILVETTLAGTNAVLSGPQYAILESNKVYTFILSGTVNMDAYPMTLLLELDSQCMTILL